MPTLKQLTCSVEWELSKTPLQEFQTTYSDGYVETYIAVPDLPTPFSIHLQSNGYIAPGLSMFVYIDGVYQCNRNRQNLKIPDENTTKKQTEVNFRVRQKEQMSWNGSFCGKPWKFERVNIVSDLNVAANERAPHDGEYVGTIEVVVLRCYPSASNPSFSSAETLITRGSSLTSDSTTDNDGLPTSLDGAGDPKPKLVANPRPQPRSQALSFDGAWDDPGPSTSPNEGQRTSREEPWDSWDTVPAAKEDPSSKSWGKWDEPSSAKDEQRMGTVEMTSANTGIYHPPSGSSSIKAASKAGSVSGFKTGSMIGSKAGSLVGSEAGCMNGAKAGSLVGSEAGCMNGAKAGSPFEFKAGCKAGSIAGPRRGSQSSNSWGNSNEASSAKDEPKRGLVETTHPNTATYTLVGGSSSTKTASKAGSQSGFQGDRFRKAPSATGHQTPRTTEFRGGGTSSYTVRSRHGSAAGSPVFNVGFYNGAGTPPPLNMGPPPPRNWLAEEAAKKAKAKQGHKPAEQPSVDAWGDLPNNDTAGVETGPRDKVDSWNVGGSDMPGAWDTSNKQKKDDQWGTTSEKPQQNNDDAWGAPPLDIHNDETSNNAGNDSGWGASNGDALVNGTWPGAGKASDWDEPAKDDAGGISSNENPIDNGENWEEFNHNNEAQPSDDSNGNDTSNAQQKTDWNAGQGPDEDGSNKQNNSWGNDNAEEHKPADEKPAPAKGSKKGSKAGSVGKGSKAGSVGKAASVKPKGKSPPSTGPGNAAGSKKPGGWSPPPKLKKGTPTQAVQPVIPATQDKPSFTISTVPKAKAYWSTWKSPNDDEEEIIEEEPALPAQDPLYAIPEEVAVRNNMSHQVRPGRPSTYTHKVSRPKYMDTHENPYAVFVFQYRDKAIIEDMLKTAIEAPGIDEKQRLASLPKAELIEELLKEKARSASGSSASEKAATFKSNPRGFQLEPNASALKAKLSKLEESKAATPDMVGAWMDSSPENGNSSGTGSANGKGNWDKKPKNKGKKNKEGGNWANNRGDNRGSGEKKDGDTAGDAGDNYSHEPADDKKENDDDGNWGGFDQDAGASLWGNEVNKGKGNGGTTAGGGGDESWEDNAAGGGGGGW